MKTKTLASLLLCSLALIAFTGCKTPADAVPRSEISASLYGKPMRVLLPKDMEADEIKFSATTNGAVDLSIKNIKTRMNPDVITVSTRGYAEMRKADLELLKGGVESVGGAAAKFAP